jgi:hypothetical protein
LKKLKKKKMNKLIALTLVAFSLVLVNCKDKSGDDPEPTKTLNKSLITDKYWKMNTAPNFGFYFGSDNKLYLPDGKTEYGTWMWLNNSDSMEVDKPSTSGKTVWYAEYCTETELKMRASGNPVGSGYIFYKQ